VKDRVEIERRMRDKAVKECRGDEELVRRGIGSKQSLLVSPQSAVLLVRMCCVCCRLGVCHVEGGSQVQVGRSGRLVKGDVIVKGACVFQAAGSPARYHSLAYQFCM
jgi:hypothetical protein